MIPGEYDRPTEHEINEDDTDLSDGAQKFEDDTGEPPPISVDWWKLSAKDRAEYLTILSGFVQRLVVTYVVQEQVIPRCWYLHEGLVHDLLSVWQYREQVVYDHEGAAGSAHVWHTDLYAHIFPRLRQKTGEYGCNAAEHFPDELKIPAWVKTGEVAAAAFDTDFKAWIKELNPGLREEE